jgi:hypothetical protein
MFVVPYCSLNWLWLQLLQTPQVLVTICIWEHAMHLKHGYVHTCLQQQLLSVGLVTLAKYLG